MYIPRTNILTRQQPSQQHVHRRSVQFVPTSPRTRINQSNSCQARFYFRPEGHWVSTFGQGEIGHVNCCTHNVHKSQCLPCFVPSLYHCNVCRHSDTWGLQGLNSQYLRRGTYMINFPNGCNFFFEEPGYVFSGEL